jgi:hypothetical protein
VTEEGNETMMPATATDVVSLTTSVATRYLEGSLSGTVLRARIEKRKRA